MSYSYWEKVLAMKMSRRRAVAATGATATAAALLAACGGGGGGGGGSGTPSKGSELVAKPEDTTGKAKRGGTMKWTQANEPLHFDGQAQGQAQLNIYNGMVYEALVRNKPGVGQPSTYTEVLPNLAESWEISGDKLQITFKLRQGVKWQNIPPVSGRLFDSSDVTASIERYVNHPTANNAPANFNSRNPGAPILSVTAPDAKTIVYKLKEPSSYIMQRIAVMITGELGQVYPKEALSGGYDPRKQQIGTGGYMLENYTPSASLTYKRNPDYWNKDTIWTDLLDMPIINDPTQRLAQLKTGGIYAAGGIGAIAQENILPTKRDVPAMNMYAVTPANNNTSFIQRFGWKDLSGRKSPFLDVRVRQAMALAMDRDSYIDAFSNVSKFEADGLPVDVFYHTAMGYVPGVTLDPTDTKTFGDNAKYYKLDLAEAKKLLSAAGYPSGFEYTNHWPNFPAFGANFPKQMAVIESFNTELGLKVSSDPIDYNLQYLPNYVTKRGQHEGILVSLGAVTSPDPTDYYVWRYYSKSGATSGAIFGDVGSGAGEGDPKVDDFIEKAKAEFDAKKNIAILQDLQRYLAGMQYCVTSPGLATSFDLAWPTVKNYLALQGDSRAINSYYYTWWLDENEAPLKKA